MRLATLLLMLSIQAAGQTPCGKGPRNSPCMPSPGEQRALMRQVEISLNDFEAWERARVAEDDLRREIMERHSEDREAWSKALAKLEEREVEMRKSFAQVVSATTRAYGVGPPVKYGKVQGGHLAGETAIWNPKIREERFLYAVRRVGKPTVYLGFSNSPNEGGGTLDDGAVIISLESLRRAKENGSPAVIAAVIDHEADHFQHLIAPGGGWTSRDALEAGGYGRELAIAEAIGLEESEKEDIRSRWAAHFNRSWPRETAEQLRGGEYRPGPNSEDYPYVKTPESHYKAWKDYQRRLDEIRKERDKLNLDLQAGAAAPDDSRDALNGRRVPPSGSSTSNGCGGEGWWAGDVYMPPLPCPEVIYSPTPSAVSAHAEPAPVSAAPPSPLPVARAYLNTVHYLADWARRACGAPPTLEQSSLDELWPHLAPMEFDENAAGELAGCERSAFLILLRWRARGEPRASLEALKQGLPASAPVSDTDVGAVSPIADPCAAHGSFGGIQTGCIKK